MTIGKLPIVRPEFDKPFKYLRVHPRSMAEAVELSDAIKAEVEEITRQIDDPTRRDAMSIADYLTWEKRARKSRWVKQQQLGELRDWRAARSPNLEPGTAETKKAARQQAHAERMRRKAEMAGVQDDHDPIELLRLLRSVVVNCMDDGVEFTEHEQALFDVVQVCIQDAEARRFTA